MSARHAPACDASPRGPGRLRKARVAQTWQQRRDPLCKWKKPCWFVERASNFAKEGGPALKSMGDLGSQTETAWPALAQGQGLLLTPPGQAHSRISPKDQRHSPHPKLEGLAAGFSKCGGSSAAAGVPLGAQTKASTWTP